MEQEMKAKKMTKNEMAKKMAELKDRVAIWHEKDEIAFRERGVHICPTCFGDMEMQYDHIQKKKSPYLWRCKVCMPPNMVVSIG
jgi:hypothetical protein